MSEVKKSAVITGGTGFLGRAVVRAFLGAGYCVTVPYIVDQERERAEQDEATALAAGDLSLLELDVAEEAGAARLIEAAGADGIDVLVNGVGGFAGGTPVHETDLETWDRLYRMNLRTGVCCSRAALPGMLARGGGRILFVAAAAVETCPQGLSAYVASKAGVVSLARTLANEVRGRGIRVNAVAPTTIDTPPNREAMPDANFDSWTKPAEIAQILLFLASEASQAAHGAVIPV